MFLRPLTTLFSLFLVFVSDTWVVASGWALQWYHFSLHSSSSPLQPCFTDARTAEVPLLDFLFFNLRTLF
jgi:hypothetical protein